MEEADKGWLMSRRGVSGWMFLLVPAHSGRPGQRAVKRLCVCVCVCRLGPESGGYVGPPWRFGVARSRNNLHSGGWLPC